MLLSPQTCADAARLLDELRAGGLQLATAESCTGGLIAGALTSVAGSSDVMERGFVTYSNAAKTELLGVPADLVARLGAVSGEVAAAMAEGALARSPAGVAVAVTGIAGPGGGSADKPVGLVYVAAASRAGRTAMEECRFGDVGRDRVRELTVVKAIELVRKVVR